MFLNLEDFEIVDDSPSVEQEGEDWVKIKDGDWVSMGKWEVQESVVYNLKSGKYYKYMLYRSGSYYSDYYYSHIEDDHGVNLVEVERVEKTVTIVDYV